MLAGAIVIESLGRCARNFWAKLDERLRALDDGFARCVADRGPPMRGERAGVNESPDDLSTGRHDPKSK
jgi:hypothetical protein